MSFYTPFNTYWVHPAVVVVALATAGLLVLLLFWAMARGRRPPPCDEQEGDQTLG